VWAVIDRPYSFEFQNFAVASFLFSRGILTAMSKDKQRREKKKPKKAKTPAK